MQDLTPEQLFSVDCSTCGAAAGERCRLQYHGPLGDRDAEMVVKVEYQAPAKKQFTMISQSGSKFINDRIFKKLLEGEQEAFQLENREATALNTDNYAFELEG